ncbi:MAG: nitrous oxide reductase family maturation protein NosD [Cyclobacteriaceae bacterium]|nr:nitrous oxide reductase family maturation protein NosD [Cyclobacteriaceae bacterium]
MTDFNFTSRFIANGVIFCALFYPISASARSIRVGLEEKVRSLRAAIEMADPGDSILVEPGTYKEGNLIVQKMITIIGEHLPVIDGEGKYEIFTVAASGVTIQGLKLVNTGRASIHDIAAIKGLDAVGLSILDNQFVDAFFGIHLSNSSDCIIRGNTLTSTVKDTAGVQSGNGIHLWKCNRVTISKNTIEGHRDGIYFEFVTKSRVVENISRRNLRYGLHFMFSHDDDYLYNIFTGNGSGVAVMYTRNVKMTGNRFLDSKGAASYALLLKDIGDSRIEQCRFEGNTVAIYMEGSSRMIIQDNEFRENGWAMKVQASCDGNLLKRNNFVRNTFDISTNGSISLNTITSNYWDKYDGYDLNRDGHGDVPFHPVSLYGMIVEKMPTAVMLWRSFLVFLIDRAEKVVPAVTPANLKDDFPAMKAYDRD